MAQDLISTALDIPRHQVESCSISEYRRRLWRSVNISALNFGGEFLFEMPLEKYKEDVKYFREMGLLN